MTDDQDRIVEEKHAESALINSKYPRWTVKTTKQAIKNKGKKTQNRKQQKDHIKPRGQVILPYLRGTTERLTKIYKSCGIRFAIRLAITLA